jgi:hypothetical protein
MVIYMIARSHGRTDSDGWQHWVEHCPVSYHITEEGAKAKVELLISKEVEKWEQWIIKHPHNKEDYTKVILNVKKNISILSVGDGGRDTEEHESFVITPLNVED